MIIQLQSFAMSVLLMVFYTLTMLLHHLFSVNTLKLVFMEMCYHIKSCMDGNLLPHQKLYFLFYNTL